MNIPIWIILAVINIILLVVMVIRTMRECMGLEGLGKTLALVITIVGSVIFWLTWVVRGAIK